jgi:hypothetical protein
MEKVGHVTRRVNLLVDVWIQEKTLSPLTNLLNTTDSTLFSFDLGHDEKFSLLGNHLALPLVHQDANGAGTYLLGGFG